MPKERSASARIFSTAVFILLEIASLLMLNNNNTLQRLWLSRVSHAFMAKTWGACQGVAGYFMLRKQNDELALENEALRNLLRDYGVKAAAADSSFAPYTPGDGFKYIPAKIIKSGTSNQHNYLILDKGSDDGIKENSGIVTGKGVIGIVDAVSRHYSYAISFLNAEVNISARMGTSGAVGPLSWDGISTDGAVMREVPLQFRFEPGDTVYTSGYSAIFPPDIPLGVAGEAKVINGATNEVKVRLFQGQSALKYVTIVENTRAEEIRAIEGSPDIQKP
ncbi:MAG: rod shape-determining protein MreC [Bacteroidales bacterium]|jgi:rod shape-determining protein MreC|nr:rod shape-determining protein MreC [Bacteroidales bacterium]